MRERPAIDVSGLPTTAFRVRDPLWWGVVGIMCIEGTMFAIMAGSYFYLRGGAQLWPPSAETSTCRMRPFPDQAKPEISAKPASFNPMPGDVYLR